MSFQIWSRRALMLAVIFSFALVAPMGHASEAIWTHQFAAESGFPVSLSRNAEPEDTTLVMFWANWCLPCKGELAELAKQKAMIPKNLKLVAINVDDPSGLPLAQSFMASIQWPFQSLRDSSGQFFFDYNRSGQLPYSVLLGPGGKEIKSYQKLTDTDIHDIISRAGLAPTIGSEVKVTSGTTQFGIHGEGVDYTGSNDVHNRLATISSYGRFDTEKWTGQVQYDFLYQEFSTPRSVQRGDEIGFSYLEYRTALGSGRGRIRGGDSHIALLSGELLSLQKIPNLTNPASLRGGYAEWDQGAWSLAAFGGAIHPALFASPIDPTRNLALPVPGEKAQGASIFWHDEEADRKTQANLNVVNYHRDINLAIGNSSTVDDFRWGGEVYHRSGKSGLQVRGASFSRNTGDASVEAERPYIIDPYFWWTFPGAERQIYSLHYIEYQSLPERTLTPVLVENPATPLQAVSKVRSFRFSPKLLNEAESIWFEPIWIFEESFLRTPYERQNSFGFNLSLPREDMKLIAFYQDALTSPTSNYREISGLATSPLYGPLTGQLLVRHHDASPNGGDSAGLNLGVDLSQLWKMPAVPGRVLFSSQWTRQSGYYFGFSGLSRADLFSSHLEWISGVNSVRLGVGAEPGGIVCTNGVCVQKPPLNGVDLEIAFNF